MTMYKRLPAFVISPNMDLSNLCFCTVYLLQSHQRHSGRQVEEDEERGEEDVHHGGQSSG